jgi:D-tyrosyl-tRNA(Tyr) deacylase
LRFLLGNEVKVLLQRVSQARVEVQGSIVGEIGQGLLILVCAEPSDTESVSQRMIDKIVKLRIFEDEQGKMNRSALDVAGELLIVSQFTLVADTARGNRPSYTNAAPPELARSLYNTFVTQARLTGLRVATGQFAAHMVVSLINDGPVTIPISLS